MKEIIFWFDTIGARRKYYKEALDYLYKTFNYTVKFNETHSYIIIDNLKIWFKPTLEIPEKPYELKLNQYWVDELFENDFEEFFLNIVKENLYGSEGN